LNKAQENLCAKYGPIVVKLLRNKATTPTKKGHIHQISRFYDNTFAFISPVTKQLHMDNCQNSPANLSHHSIDTIRVSQTNTLQNIDCIIDHGKIFNNPEAAAMFDEMEKFVQRSNIEIQKLIIPKQLTPQKEGTVEFATFNGKKKCQSQD
jgi:hypothetical protein